ncbi:MAG TPA: hypothetical protein VNO55_30860 [Polyangia bacterium]|nr:hypothetical protein [Polyangia bacterium]
MRRAFRATPRFFNTALAGWLAVSALLWPHSTPQRISTFVSGALILLLETAARRVEWAHRLTGLVASWVILSLFVIWPRPMTAWNNLLIGVAVAVFSVMEADRPVTRRRRRV